MVWFIDLISAYLFAYSIKDGRKIIKITGNLSATNFLEIPNNKFTKSLNFSGKSYYIFIKTFSDKTKEFHKEYDNTAAVNNRENLLWKILDMPKVCIKILIVYGL